MIFISYRNADSLEMVDRLDNDLTREFGEPCVFRDKSRLAGGDDWTKELERSATTRKVMLVVIGATWQSASFTDGDQKGFPRLSAENDWVRKEITLALDAGAIVIPVFLNGAAMPSDGWLANCKLDRLGKKQGERLRISDYTHDLANLIAVMRKKCPDLPPQRDGDPARSPPRPLLPKPPDLYAVPNYIRRPGAGHLLDGGGDRHDFHVAQADPPAPQPTRSVALRFVNMTKGRILLELLDELAAVRFPDAHGAGNRPVDSKAGS